MQHSKRIDRSYGIAAKEVTVEQFLRFRMAYAYNNLYAPTSDCPVNEVTWYDATAYCNWLSKQEEIPEGGMIVEQHLYHFLLEFFRVNATVFD